MKIMADMYACRLDSEKGTICFLGGEDHVFAVSSGDTVEFQIEGGSAFANEDTQLIISQNSSPEVIHKGSFKAGHWHYRLTLTQSGSTKFYLVLNGKKSITDYIIVNPRLSLNNEPIKPESLSMLTVLSRSLGHINNWKSIISDQISLGYNFFHITPVQELGGSHSLYCIKDPNTLNPTLFSGYDKEGAYTRLAETINEIDSLGAACMVDVVLNHIAYDTEFIEQHPEASYNLENCPYLRAAYALDKALYDFSVAIIQKRIQSLNNKNKIENQKDLTNIMNLLKLEWLPRLKLHEFFQMDVSKIVKNFEMCDREADLDENKVAQVKSKGLEYFIKNFALMHEGEGAFLTDINYEMVWKACRVLGHTRENSIKEVKKVLPVINSYLLSRFDKHFAEILTNIEGDIRYHKIEQGKVEITHVNPIVRRYFQELNNGHVVLHNGFIMGNNEVLKDFAGKENWHYFRRNVVIWADNIKLRYGNSPEDCPALWQTMKEYVVSMAKIFKAIRLDNAHGTPLSVSSYMLQAARAVNPDLYIMAELFTSDSKLDAHFVKVLGINGLVREGMNAVDPGNLGGLVYSYGQGESCSLGRLESLPFDTHGLFISSTTKPLKSSKVPAVFYDCTHDNPTPVQCRKAHDALPSAAIISMGNCMIASTRGYDEFIPQQLSVVTENRVYKLYSDDICPIRHNLGGDLETMISFSVDDNKKISKVQVKGEWDNWTQFFDLNKVSEYNYQAVLLLPNDMAGREFQYKFVLDNTNWVCDWKQPQKKTGNITNNYLIIGKPTHCGVYENMRRARQILNNLHVKMGQEGFEEIYVHQFAKDLHMIIRQQANSGDSFVLVARNAFWDDINLISQYDMKLPGIVTEIHLLSVLSFKTWGFIKDPNVVNGMKGHLEILTNLDQFGSLTRDAVQNIDVLNLTKIPQGFVLILKTELSQKNSLVELNETYKQLLSPSFVLNDLNLEQLNHILWRSGPEELDISNQKRDVYRVPNTPGFNYAGIGGLVIEFKKLVNKNALSGPIIDNIRSGNWLLDYTKDRLARFVPDHVANFVSAAIERIKSLPRNLIPKHFVKFVLALFYYLVRYQVCTLFKIDPVNSLEMFLLTAVSQFWGHVPSAACETLKASLSAGLPHFTVGYMRVWGRDTFISFKGLLLETSQFVEARSTILTFASVVRHGLIPNLLDTCRNCRYNSRDSTWFFLNGVKQFIKKCPNGHLILQEQVTLVFKGDNQSEHNQRRDEPKLTLEDIIQEILQKHALGIQYREWNAGTQIDAHMRDEGFNIKIALDTATGLIYGGNRWNCGTWMDKMGSSSKSGNAGVPSTPRDGCNIEITALVYSTISYLSTLHSKGQYKYASVKLADGRDYLYSTWKENLQRNVEKLFFVPKNGDRPGGYYRDTVGNSVPRCELQIRPNQCVALAVAKGLFNEEHAVEALEVIKKELFPGLGNGQIGIRTLNDGDPAYRSFYDNANDSNDPSVAHGASYHNGPEWLWPVGYYLLAVLRYTKDTHLVMKCVKEHLKWFENSEWMSLPELTNGFGNLCSFSCSAQAWSIAPLIQVMQKLKKNKVF